VRSPNAILRKEIDGKVIVRTGAFNPWGNIGLICGTDPDDWFTIPSTVMPSAYRERRLRMVRQP